MGWPLLIADKLSPLTYRLKCVKGGRVLKGTFHIHELKLHVERETKPLPKSQTSVRDAEPELSQVIEPLPIACNSDIEINQVIEPLFVEREADDDRPCSALSENSELSGDISDNEQSPNSRSLRPRNPVTGRAICS